MEESLKPVIRSEDGELLGFIQKLRDADQWQTFTFFKYPLQLFDSERKAETAIQSAGLSILMEKWYFFDPTLNDWFGCHIVEASPGKVRYKITDFGHPRLYEMESIVAPDSSNFKLNL